MYGKVLSIIMIITQCWKYIALFFLKGKYVALYLSRIDNLVKNNR